MGRFDGKVALVTGAGAGIGETTARRLAREGAAVAIGDIEDAHGKRIVDDIQREGGQAIFIHLDVSEEDDWAAAITRLESELGPCQALHSNAALVARSLAHLDREIDDLTVEHWDRVMSVNVRGAMLAARHVVPSMERAGGGSIVFTASISAFLAKPTALAYATSKSALLALSRGVAARGGPVGIRSNVVAPGPVETQATADIDPELKRLLIKTSMIPRFATPEDIAGVVTFLLSEDAAMVTGQSLLVDGGVSAAYPNPNA